MSGTTSGVRSVAALEAELADLLRRVLTAAEWLDQEAAGLELDPTVSPEECAAALRVWDGVQAAQRRALRRARYLTAAIEAGGARASPGGRGARSGRRPVVVARRAAAKGGAR